MSRCSMCSGTGRTEPTALDRLDLAETGVMDLQCLACDGTGQTMLTPPHGLWCNHCQVITINATRCTGHVIRRDNGKVAGNVRCERVNPSTPVEVLP